MIHPGGDVGDLAGLKMTFFMSDQKPVPWLDHRNACAPERPELDVEAGELLIAGRHSTVQQQKDGTPLEVASLHRSDDGGYQAAEAVVVD